MSKPERINTDAERDQLWDYFVEKVVRVVVQEQYDFALGLARMDVLLMREECKLSVEIDTGASDAVDHVYREEMLKFHSALWVLGAYELVRALDERLHPERHASHPFPDVQKLKRMYERVRIPLVKLEKAERASAPSDVGIALPARSPTGECQWLLGDESISRRDLADALLRLQPALARRQSAF
jgi:hypothetical protein